jgi:oxygen-independent coproporphyrinogen-3 oxidase
LLKEIKITKNYLKNETIQTIYFGGGTPSLLTVEEINRIIEEISVFHNLSNEIEISLEMNPDDIFENYVKDLVKTGVNRISLGIQSFFEEDLKLMNRRHTVLQSFTSVPILKSTGFKNISCDLIYALTGMTLAKWKQNLHYFFETESVHLSAYHITYEPKTTFTKFLKTGKLKEIDEALSIRMMDILIEETEKHGMIWYETSNFAKPGYFSKHNMSYWMQEKYLGLGPAAHSYNHRERRFNHANLNRWIDAINSETQAYDVEILSPSEIYNDYILTSLRTIWGVDLKKIRMEMGIQYYDHILKQLNKQIEYGYIFKDNDQIYLTKKGKLIENTILEKLFFV